MKYPTILRGMSKSHLIMDKEGFKSFIAKYKKEGYEVRLIRNRVILTKNGCGFNFNLI